MAKFYAAEGGQRVVHAAAHLHGGVGVSREHPLRRYHIWAKQLELALGSPQYSVSRLGRLLADEPVGPDPAPGMLPVPGADEFSRARLSYQY